MHNININPESLEAEDVHRDYFPFSFTFPSMNHIKEYISTFRKMLILILGKLHISLKI